MTEGRKLIRECYLPRPPARIIEGPTVRVLPNGQVKVSFTLDRADDVLLCILDGQGRFIRHLACGVLNDNAPPPLVAGSLKQHVLWDGKDDAGARAPAGDYAARLSVGFQSHFATCCRRSPRYDEVVENARKD